jgi:hypothetical protein
MRTISVVVATLVLGAAPLLAQNPRPTVELRPFAGVTIPTGSQRDLYKDAPIAGLGIAVQMRPNLHLVGNFGWMREHTKYAVTRNDADRYQYDAGVEFSLERDISASWTFRPFVGVGGGARTYDYQAATLLTRTGAAGYGAIGAEFRTGLTALRFEARDNVFSVKSPLAGGTSDTRNDMTFGLGLSYHLW